MTVELVSLADGKLSVRDAIGHEICVIPKRADCSLQELQFAFDAVVEHLEDSLPEVVAENW